MIALCGAAALAFVANSAWAGEGAEASAGDAATEAATAETDAGSGEETIVVTGYTGTKTDTALMELPQPIKVITAEQYQAQGAISISDTVKYAAGVLANPYGRDTRVDGFNVRGLDALQFRDGVRDIFSYYASITSDPYNFSRVEIVRGPASVLFGQGSIGGLVNLVSKTPDFTTRGEINLVYGSYDRKEVLGDVNLALADNLAVRFVGCARDAYTYVDHVPDDRVMFAPSIRWQPTPDTDVVLTGLYQEDDTGSTSQFLPIIGTFRPNTVAGEQLGRYTFVGKAGWDRYAGRSLQGGGSVTHRFSDNVKLSLKARYIDSDLEYKTHYADSYTNPQNPFSVYGTDGRTIGLYADASDARMNVFSTDNNLQLNFNSGANIEHKLLVGIDYSWNKVQKRGIFGFEIVDLYDIDYDALLTYDPSGPFTTESQKQLGVYLQDQIRFFDRVSVVLGARRDRVTGSSGQKDNATTFRAGIIGEIGAGFSPFLSYTESFLPVAGRIDNGDGTFRDRGEPHAAGQFRAAGQLWLFKAQVGNQHQPRLYAASHGVVLDDQDLRSFERSAVSPGRRRRLQRQECVDEPRLVDRHAFAHDGRRAGRGQLEQLALCDQRHEPAQQQIFRVLPRAWRLLRRRPAQCDGDARLSLLIACADAWGRSCRKGARLRPGR